MNSIGWLARALCLISAACVAWYIASARADLPDDWCAPASPYGDAATGEHLDIPDYGYYSLSGDEDWHDVTVGHYAVLDTQGYRLRVCGELVVEANGAITDTRTGGSGGSGGTGGKGANPHATVEPTGCGRLSRPCSSGADGLSGDGPLTLQAGENGRGGYGGGGGGGGGGAWQGLDYVPDADGGNGADGADGGEGGGYVLIYAYRVNNQGVIHADGEPGDQGDNAPDGDCTDADGYWNCGGEYYDWPNPNRDLAGGGGGGGGGGCGGNGGTVEIHYCHRPSEGTSHAYGGTGAGGGYGGDRGGPYQQNNCYLYDGVFIGGHDDAGCGGGDGYPGTSYGRGGQGGRGAHQSGDRAANGSNGQAGGAGEIGTVNWIPTCPLDTGLTLDWSPSQIIRGNPGAVRATAWSARTQPTGPRLVQLRDGVDVLAFDSVDIPPGGSVEITLLFYTDVLSEPSVFLELELEPFPDEPDSDNNIVTFSMAVLNKSQADTLLFAEASRIEAEYGAAAWQALAYDLVRFTTDANVLGVLVDLHDNPVITSAFALWDAAPEDQTRANNVVAAIDDHIQSLLNTEYTTVTYLVPLGKDELVPFWRVPAGWLSPESDYSHLADPNCDTTVKYAFEENLFLTDSYYADAQNEDPPVPDYAIGRLVESPAQIRAQLDTFLESGPLITIRNVGVIGHDILTDMGERDATLFEAEFPAADISTLFGDECTDESVIGLFSDPPSKQYIGVHCHASHRAIGDPYGQTWYVRALPENIGVGSNGSLVTIGGGCHAGLNVGDPDCSLDWPEVFVSGGAKALVGNTTYSFVGLFDWLPMWHEILYALFAQNLCDGMSIGDALAHAKITYLRWFFWVDPPNGAQRRTLLAPTLYGLPHYRYDARSMTRALERPVPLDQPSQAESVVSGVKTHTINGRTLSKETRTLHLGAYTRFDDGQGGAFYLADTGSAAYDVGTPVLPLIFSDLGWSGLRAHGAVLTAEQHCDQLLPNITLGTVCTCEGTYAGSFQETVWYPPVQHMVNSVIGVNQSAGTLAAVTGQYHAPTGTLRLFDEVTYNVYYSDADDWQPPVIATVYHTPWIPEDGAPVTICVAATYDAGISEVVIRVSMDCGGTWESQEATLNPQTGIWELTLTKPHYAQGLHYVNVIDNAGNVNVDKNDGAFFAFHLRGDLNCDGVVNTFDIDPFVQCLTTGEPYPGCNCCRADCNCNGLVNTFDIDPFVALLTGG